MAPTPPSTGSSITGLSPDAQHRVVRKRNRVPLSCAPCRHKKLKCNRSHPCENCIRRGDAAGCSYAAPGPRRKAPLTAAAAATGPDDMQNRIDRLEGLVLALMTNGGQAPGAAAAAAALSQSMGGTTAGTGTMTTSSGGASPEFEEDGDDGMGLEEEGDSEVEEVEAAFGVLKVDSEAEKTLYIGGNYWYMVLADIAEVKNYFAAHKREMDAHVAAHVAPPTPGLAFLFNAHVPTTEAGLRAGLPARSKVEKLVSRFFNSLDHAVQVLHFKTFHDRVAAYFDNPLSQSVAWVGLLYATLTLAMQSYAQVGDEPPEWKGRTRAMADEYRNRTVQALIACDYTKPNAYTIETLILYVHGEYIRKMDVDVGLWLVVGTAVQLALRVGYHRDCAQFPGVTPYEAEMRRRVWLFVRQCDIIFSAQLALPCTIKSSDCDTQFPRNIFDDEFAIDTKELPPARPDSEATPMSYVLAHARLALLLGDIIEQTQPLDGRPVPYDAITARDAQLQALHARLPPHLRPRPLADAPLDPASLLLQRLHLDVLHHKTRCVLHRRFLARARTNPRYAPSRRAAIDAAMALLRTQALLHREARPGGRLHALHRFVSALQRSDFLLGAMIVCLELNSEASASSAAAGGAGRYDRCFWTAAQRADMVGALEEALALWEAEPSIEAFKAAKILRIMLEKLRAQQPPPAAVGVAAAAQPDGIAAFDEGLGQEHSAAMTLGMLSSGAMTPAAAAAMFGATVAAPGPMSPGRYGAGAEDQGMGDVGAGFAMGGGPASPFTQLFGAGGAGMSILDLPDNLDWAAWDQYVQTGSPLDPAVQQQYYPGAYDAAAAAAPDLAMDDQGGDAYGGAANGVFMGANTPGRI